MEVKNDNRSPIERSADMIDKAIKELNIVSNIFKNPPDVQDHEFRIKMKNLIQDAEISVKISLENLFA
jgi:hypothetical protein